MSRAREQPTNLDAGPHADPESVARSILLRRLSDRPRTRAELAESLHKKDVPDDIARRLLDRFTEVGLIDDQEFARAWVESRLAGKGLARRALGVELRRKGVPDDVVVQALSEIDPDDEVAAAHRLVRRKMASMRGLSREVALRRLVGVLGRKGFPPGVAFRVVKEELDEPFDEDF